MSNLQVTVSEQPSTQINSTKSVPYDLMLPFLIPHLDAGKAVELQTLPDKYKVCFSNQFHYHLLCAKNY